MPPTRTTEETLFDGAHPFSGFALPTSNTTYTPNQFFDVCLPHYPRGVVRLVGYLIRRTLGWSDADGNPVTERHAVSYEDLEWAGVSRDMIRDAINQAVKGHFITCVREPRPHRPGRPAQSGLYELKWDEGSEYVKDPARFRGFFAGEGNRTYIPNQFFDALLPRESLSVLKVVGSVIRFSIGFQTRWGHRRRNVALSYQHMQNYARIRNRTVLSGALSTALERNYIERVEEGYFDPEGGRLSKAAVYALKWLNPAAEGTNGQKSVPAENVEPKRPENRTGNGQKTVPAGRSENRTGLKITGTNNTSKQQGDAAAAFSKLRAAGFDERAARAIASMYPFERIERQLRWLDRRHARENRLGLLRTAITEDWPEPVTREGGRRLGQPNPSRPAGADFGEALGEARRRFLGQHNQSTP